MALLNGAPKWRSPRSSEFVLWHGCTAADEAGIRANGIDLGRSKWALDFGRGFYTTTLERQAKQWAKLRSDARRTFGHPSLPVVMRFRIGREALAGLASMHFVRGHFDSLDFWSLVQHCRRSIDPDPTRGIVGRMHDHCRHGLVAGSAWYDMVAGPVAAFWQQRAEMGDADHYSFHTVAGVRVLNAAISAGPPDYRCVPVKGKVVP